MLGFVAMGQQVVPIRPAYNDGLRRPPAAPIGVPVEDWVFFTRDPANTNGASPDYVVPVGKTLVLTGLVNRLSSSNAVIELRTGPFASFNPIVATSVSKGTTCGSGCGERAPTTQAFKVGPVLGIPVQAGEEIRFDGGIQANALQ